MFPGRKICTQHLCDVNIFYYYCWSLPTWNRSSILDTEIRFPSSAKRRHDDSVTHDTILLLLTEVHMTMGGPYFCKDTLCLFLLWFCFIVLAIIKSCTITHCCYRPRSGIH